jgi:hypothetical protein
MSVHPTVTFHQVDPKGGSLTALLGQGVPTVTAAGGWNMVQREKQTSITEWQGFDPISMDIPIVFDGFMTGASVEHSINSLYWLMRTPQGARHEPAVLTLKGPVPYTNLRWVINNIQPASGEDDEIRRSDGQRVRFTATVTLVQHVAGNVVVTHKHSPAKRHKATSSRRGSTTRVRYYNVRSGDTLGKIAAKLLHNANRWHDIAKLNGIRDPNNLKVGRRLKIPA